MTSEVRLRVNSPEGRTEGTAKGGEREVSRTGRPVKWKTPHTPLETGKGEARHFHRSAVS